MMGFFSNLFEIKDSNYFAVSGLNLELFSLYIYDTYLKKQRGMIVVTNSLYEANMLVDTITNYTDRVLFFPMDDFITSEALAISPEFKSERINAINKLVDDNKYIVITNLMGILRYLPSVDVWKNSILEIYQGQKIDRFLLQKKLLELGYEKETIVSETGKIGVRGFVLDIFPIGEENPIRIEFWDNEIESIKYFDVSSQLSNIEVKRIKIFPFTEFLLDNEKSDVIFKQKYLKYYSKKIAGLWNYIDNSLVFYYDYNQILDSYRLLRKTILDYDMEKESIIDTEYMFDLRDLDFEQEVFLMPFDSLLKDMKVNEYIRYTSYEIEKYNANLKKIKSDLEKFLREKKTIIICADDKKIVNKIIEYFDDVDFLITSDDNIFLEKINIIEKKIKKGFIYENYIVISTNDLFGGANKIKYNNKFKLGVKVDTVDSLTKGDYVVHVDHGIGIYDELCTIKKNGYKKDYIKLIYSGNDVLYIPIENIDRISKFSARDGIIVKLDSLGNDKWQKRKARVKGRLEEIASNLLKIYAERESKKGYSFSKDDENQVLFDSSFIYTETPDQLRAINIIKEAMEKPKPMDMLLCGDVGYGKTEVAFRAMFKAINDGKQVAYLCPTTILSNQQYNNALVRFKDFPVNIAILNRFVSKKDQQTIIKKLIEGKIDILFGTHRILSKDIGFKDIGLLVIDEEQRFGVTHKEKIKEYKSNIDVLTLSATPIPRTLQMSMSGIRSLALIETPPEHRLPIQTYVLGENNNIIKDAIYKELSRKGQAFILFNSVSKIERKVLEINELVPEARIDFAHGQMTKLELENKMQNFIDYKYDVMICTTIIETGIDIPNVNTLIVLDADKFGLSQLYQIRGRIGRSDKIGYAYLMYNDRKELNDIAVKRLNTIKEFTELGSGFKIAMRDLSIRGAGDILGSEQSGFIDSIGIDLYLKMLKDAVDKLKGKNTENSESDNSDNKSLINVDTYISDDYVNDDDLKIELHKKINSISSLEELFEIKAEIENRFGKINREMELYMYEELFEKLAKKIEVINVVQTNSYIDLELSSQISKKIDGESLFLLAYDVSENFRLKFNNNKIHIILDFINLDKHFLVYLIEISSRLIDLLKKESND